MIGPSLLSLSIFSFECQFVQAGVRRPDPHHIYRPTQTMVLRFTKLFRAALAESVPKAKQHMLKECDTTPKALLPKQKKPKKPTEVILIEDEESEGSVGEEDMVEELKALQVKVDDLFADLNFEYDLKALLSRLP